MIIIIITIIIIIIYYYVAVVVVVVVVVVFRTLCINTTVLALRVAAAEPVAEPDAGEVAEVRGVVLYLKRPRPWFSRPCFSMGLYGFPHEVLTNFFVIKTGCSPQPLLCFSGPLLCII